MRHKVFATLCLTWAVLIVLAAGSYSGAAAEDFAAFYRGKVIRFMVPFSPGGGYDTYSRLLASALEKRLDCTVVVINKPGAGGVVAINSLYQSAKNDGLTLAIAPEGIPLAQALGASGVRFNCRKFGWLGSVYQEVRFVAVGIKSPFKTVADLKKLPEVKGGITSITSPAGPSTVLAMEVLDLENGKLVAGYPGSTELILAVNRGEAHFCVQSINHLLKKDPLLRPLAVAELKRVPEFPETPAFSEFDLKPKARRMLEIIMYGKPASRCIITPPGVAAEKINFLRKLIAECYRDTEFVARATKMGLNINPMTGAEAEEGVAKTLEITPEEVKWLKYTMFEKYLR